MFSTLGDNDALIALCNAEWKRLARVCIRGTPARVASINLIECDRTRLFTFQWPQCSSQTMRDASSYQHGHLMSPTCLPRSICTMGEARLFQCEPNWLRHIRLDQRIQLPLPVRVMKRRAPHREQPAPHLAYITITVRRPHGPPS